MASDGLVKQISDEAGISVEEAYGALGAAFQGLLSISTPSSYSGSSLKTFITINPPPHPSIAQLPNAKRIHAYGELAQFVASTVGISLDASNTALDVITSAICDNGN